jgi:hypothetical protein
VFDSTIEVLDSFQDASNLSLWSQTMQSLLLLFTFDNIEFIGQERFQKILGPLVNQLERVPQHGEFFKVSIDD